MNSDPPPNDVRVEEDVLGSVLYDEALLDEIPSLVPAWFYSGKHRRIFDAISELRGEGVPVDTTTVGARLRERGRMGEVGGEATLTQLMNDVPAIGARRLKAHALVLHNAFILRSLRTIALKLIAQIEQPGASGETVGGDVAEALHAILTDTPKETSMSLKQATQSAFEQIRKHYGEGGGLSGIATGYAALDALTGGFHRGDVAVLAARPGMGKSALALGIASNVAKQDHGVLLFSLEMPKEQIALRALCAEANVDLSRARVGRFSPSDWQKLTNAIVGPCANPNVIVDDKGAMSLGELRAKSQKQQREMSKRGVELGLIVVDYLQLIAHRGDNREQAIAEMSRFLKELAKDLSVPVLVLSQLNRGVESRADKRPLLSDLRESGAIEQDADIVMFVYRDDYYDPKSRAAGEVELILAKHRNGPTGIIRLGFNAPTTAFYTLGGQDADAA